MLKLSNQKQNTVFLGGGVNAVVVVVIVVVVCIFGNRLSFYMHSTLFGNVYINILIQKECHVNSC
jgi:hypothetical protein